MSSPDSKSRVIFAPKPYTKAGPTIFLSGSIDKASPTWQETLTIALAEHPVTVLNPHRPDWDSTWRESLEFPPFVEQVNWELDGMENADIIAVFFGREAKAPISLLELGLAARTKRCVICCQQGYWKRGNVMMVAKRFGIEVVENGGELAVKVKEMLADLVPQG